MVTLIKYKLRPKSFITFATGGIGSAIVDRFLNDGAFVAVVDNNVERSVALQNDVWRSFAVNNQVQIFSNFFLLKLS